MTLKQAVRQITKDWEKLFNEQSKGPTYHMPKSAAVWVASCDISEEYEVDEEWIGITPQGNIAWAYASGCSCWDGDYDEDHKPTIKELTLQHKHAPEEWEAAIIAYAITGKMQSLPEHRRYE